MSRTFIRGRDVKQKVVKNNEPGFVVKSGALKIYALNAEEEDDLVDTINDADRVEILCPIDDFLVFLEDVGDVFTKPASVLIAFSDLKFFKKELKQWFPSAKIYAQ
jgi:hypothetical protein